MKASEIRVGGFYVKNWQVREVYGRTVGGRMAYRSYDLSDGKYFGDGACSIEVLARWAERPATTDEINRLNIVEGKQEQQNSEVELRDAVRTLLRDESDEM